MDLSSEIPLEDGDKELSDVSQSLSNNSQDDFFNDLYILPSTDLIYTGIRSLSPSPPPNFISFSEGPEEMAKRFPIRGKDTFFPVISPRRARSSSFDAQSPPRLFTYPPKEAIPPADLEYIDLSEVNTDTSNISSAIQSGEQSANHSRATSRSNIKPSSQQLNVDSNSLLSPPATRQRSHSMPTLPSFIDLQRIIKDNIEFGAETSEENLELSPVLNFNDSINGEFKCANCPASFSLYSDLQRHWLSHTANDAFRSTYEQMKRRDQQYIKSYSNSQPNFPSFSELQNQRPGVLFDLWLTALSMANLKPSENSSQPSGVSSPSSGGQIRRRRQSGTSKVASPHSTSPMLSPNKQSPKVSPKQSPEYRSKARRFSDSIHNKKTYICTQCGKILSQSSNLKVHWRIHTNEKPFPCTYPGCGKRFKQKSHLKSHLNVHVENRFQGRRHSRGKASPANKDNNHSEIIAEMSGLKLPSHPEQTEIDAIEKDVCILFPTISDPLN